MVTDSSQTTFAYNLVLLLHDFLNISGPIGSLAELLSAKLPQVSVFEKAAPQEAPKEKESRH